MRLAAILTGCALLLLILTDAFNTIVLPRRTRYGLRVTRVFYRLSYRPYAAMARRIRSGAWRESFLSVYGPFSLLALIGIWGIGIVVAFGLLDWAAGADANGHPVSLFDATFLSATTLATLAMGNPRTVWLKLFTMAEGLLGLSFLGLNISYLPVLYQSFSRREVRISLLGRRAGSPPSAIGLIQCEGANPQRLEGEMAQWEQWAAELLENHLSYPMLAYFRSHHENQSWITALVAVVDAAALTVAGSEGDLRTQAGLTFAMGRHALDDIAAIFGVREPANQEDRLPAGQFSDVCERLARTPTSFHLDRLSEPELCRLRSLYEPAAIGLSRHFLMALPPWLSEGPRPQFTVSHPYV